MYVFGTLDLGKSLEILELSIPVCMQSKQGCSVLILSQASSLSVGQDLLAVHSQLTLTA